MVEIIILEDAVIERKAYSISLQMSRLLWFFLPKRKASIIKAAKRNFHAAFPPSTGGSGLSSFSTS